jgi:hypothetical protein
MIRLRKNDRVRMARRAIPGLTSRNWQRTPAWDTRVGTVVISSPHAAYVRWDGRISHEQVDHRHLELLGDQKN